MNSSCAGPEVTRGPRPRSAWFSRESFAGLFASGAWADAALLAQPFAGHDHPPPVPAAPAALPAAHVLLACSWCKQELRAAHAAKPPLPEARLQLALEFWHAARARLVAVELVNWAKSGSILHFCCLIRESPVMPMASYNWHDLVPVLGLYSQNKLIFHCIHDFDKYQVILNLSLYLDIFPLFSLKSIADMVLEHSDKVKKKS